MMRECQPSCLRFNEILRVSCFLVYLSFISLIQQVEQLLNAGIETRIKEE